MQEILAHFPVTSVTDVQPIGTGLINATFKVTTGEGIFALQKLHDVIPDAAAEDMRVVTTALSDAGMAVPRMLSTRDGAPFYRAPDGARWRMYAWLDGVVVDAVKDEHMAREAGRIVGEMHRHLARLDYRPQGSIPHFHDTAFIVDELRSVRDALPETLHAMADDILGSLPSIMLIDGEQQIIHADLKISNILFDDAYNAVGIIDFDTLLWHFRAIDLGDAYRSWCNRTAEDDGAATFDRALFQAAEEGYQTGWGMPLTDADHALHMRATQQIALELASRFLIDVVRDTYFGFDAARYATRRDANIARAQGQYHLASTIPTSL